MWPPLSFRPLLWSDPGRGRQQLGGTVPKLRQSDGAAARRAVCVGGSAGHSLQKSRSCRQLHRPGERLTPRPQGSSTSGSLWAPEQKKKGKKKRAHIKDSYISVIFHARQPVKGFHHTFFGGLISYILNISWGSYFDAGFCWCLKTCTESPCRWRFSQLVIC